MFRIILPVLALILSCNYCFSKTIITQRPVYSPYSQSYYPNFFNDINDLEKYTFDKVYSRDNNLSRLQRLENQAFGAIQTGDIVQRYDNVRNAILSRPKVNTNNSFGRNLRNYFVGQMTGYTPSLGSSSPYSNYSPYPPNRYYSNVYPPSFHNQSSSFVPSDFGNSSFVNYGSGPFFNGYRSNNFGTGSSSGVHILP